MKKVFPFLGKKEGMHSPSKGLTVPSSSKYNDESSKNEENETKSLGSSSGSATGNPRNKCALKPGHSLMDWIRLGASGVDLTGTKGVITPVNNAELAKHCHQNDAWMAIRGKVYNVTQYMEFHPGGIDELKKGMGKDATTLFNQVHAWVNYEQLLAKCFVGPLRNVVHVDLEPIKPRQKATTPTPDCTENLNNKLAMDGNDNDNFKRPVFPVRLSTSEKNSPVKSEDNFALDSLADEINNKIQQKSAAEIVPRFDWIQNTSDLTLIFYTKPFLNPGVVLSYKSPKANNIRIFIANVMHEFYFDFNNEINWPCTIKVSRETGKIDIIYKKTKPQLWTIFGSKRLENSFINTYDFGDRYEFEMENCERFNRDSYSLVLKSTEKVIIFTPIGHHISLTALIDDQIITRSYTPVPLLYLSYQNLNVSYKIGILIKSYLRGTLAKFITSDTHKYLKLQISAPKGNFSLVQLLNHTRIALIAAGSGITPMLGVLDHLLSRVNNRMEQIELLFFNKTENDIWCREYLEKISAVDERLRIKHVLSEPTAEWHGDTGRISKELIDSLNDNSHSSFVTFCCICGPTLFNDSALNLLTDAKFSTDQLHFFQG